MMKGLSKFSKHPLWPALLSALVAPGVGQIANRDYKRGILLLLIFLGGMFWFTEVVTTQLYRFLQGTPDMWQKDPVQFKNALLQLVQQNPGMFVTFYTLIILTWVFGVVDAYLSSRKKIRISLHEKSDPQR